VERQEQETGEVCDKCGSAMLLKTGRYGNFLACSGYPKCKSTRPVSSGIPCPQEGCGGSLVERMSRRGRFYGCSKYPDCKTLFQGEPVREECPLCKSPVMFRRAAKTGAGTLYCINPSCKHKKKEEPEQDLATSGKKA
jgi:DNA topoisomerase-1